LLLVGCGSSASTTDAPQLGDVAPDIAVVHVDDGTPTRQACTSTFGNALSTTFGRMDGFLVAIVPPGGGPCNADSDHVHLQVRMNGAIYDVAVDVDSPTVEDVHTTTRDLPLPGAAWSEGWHPGGTVDYVALGVHSTDLALGTKASLVSTFMSDLASANHISVFGTGYGPDGAHLVHRNGSSHDGMIVSEPLSTPSHLRMLSFTNQQF
jgi:hypothetical protein